MSDCSVCCEETKVSCVCPYCDFLTCRGCVQRYLLELTTDAKCMNCNKVWNREAVENVAGIPFRNGPYKKHRETLLFERQKALMPATQAAVTRFVRIERINKLSNDMRKYTRTLSWSDPVRAKMNQNMTQLNTRYYQVVHNRPDKPVKVTTVFRKCPCNDCKGFLNKKWKCQLCDTTICAQCNEPKGAAMTHTCNPDAVETMKLLKKDTKGCPSCGTMISKISGCSQMWCPDCHTTFDWNTMQIDNGIQHNPHYFEYMRKNGGLARQPGDVPACAQNEGLPNQYDLMMMFMPDDHSQKVWSIYRGVNHLTEVELYKYHAPIRYGQTEQSLLIEYMLNRLSEEKFKDKLQREEKYKEKTQEFRQICQMFTNVVGDGLRKLIRDRNYQEFYDGVDSIKAYAEECFKKIGNRYKCIIPKISFD